MDNSVVVVTGAGISVDSGIQPFRGKNGLWNENPTTMATYEKFKTDPGHFLSWYYHRFVSCRDALPNATHEILAANQIPALYELFEIGKNGTIDFDKSYRPHILLFDEYYAEIYETEIAMDWVAEAATIIFMGTSNSVGITNMVLESALRGGKEVIVVDPNPAPSLRYPGIQIFAESAMDFSKRYF